MCNYKKKIVKIIMIKLNILRSICENYSSSNVLYENNRTFLLSEVVVSKRNVKKTYNLI